MRRSLLSNFLLLVLLLLNAVSYAATETNCSFRTMVTTDDYSFDVSSQPADSCEKQVLRIAVLKQAVPFTHFVNPSGALVEKAWAEDIDDDGNFELIVISFNVLEPLKKSLEIYAVDGNILKQVRLPQAIALEGYRGGDSFFIENGRIVRTYPVYLPGDAELKPGGGAGRVVYQYRNREILFVPEKVRVTVAPVVPVKGVVKKSLQPVTIKSIELKQDYIEIKADKSIENYKISRIADPWRLIIDIPGAVSELNGKEVLIDKFGISRVRIGTQKDSVRLVFDSAVAPLPTETVTPAENALRVGFHQPRKK